MLCSKCATSNDDDATVCVNCGFEFPPPGQSTPKPRTRVEDAPVSEEEYYKAVIGSRNQDYYLNRFSRFDDDGQVSPTWHWPAFFVTFYWLLYRKMWLNALIYFFLPYIIMIPLGIIGGVLGSAFGGVIILGYLLYFAVAFIGIPMYANALYYRQCNKIIDDVRSTSHNTQRQLGELSGKGGTSKVVIIVILIFTFIAFIGILAAVAIPAYQAYTVKARTSQALSIGRSAENFVDDYYSQYSSIPRSLEATDFASSLPPAIKEVRLDNQTGTITVTMDGPAAINGKSILFVPALEADNRLSWTCMSEEIQDLYLPRECQRSR
jgi:type II secretory pathway pseudopilin PulG